MPDPKELKVNDRVRFVSLPEEWDDPQYQVFACSVRFMQRLIKRGRASRVKKIDRYGTPWIAARFRQGKVIHYHSWGITEETGWVKVQSRKQK